MDGRKFNEIVEQTFASVQTKLIDVMSKSDGGDYLRFYKRAGDHLDCTAERGLVGMMDNHLLSLFESVNILDKTGTLPSLDVVNTLTERVIANLICLKALIKERYNTRELSQRKDAALENIVRDALNKVSLRGQRGFKGVNSVLDEISAELNKFNSAEENKSSEGSENIDSDNEIFMKSLNEQINNPKASLQNDSAGSERSSDNSTKPILYMQGINGELDNRSNIKSLRYITELAEITKCESYPIDTKKLGGGVYISDGEKYYNIAQILLSTLNRIVNSIREMEVMKREVGNRIDTSEKGGHEAKSNEMLDTENGTRFE